MSARMVTRKIGIPFFDPTYGLFLAVRATAPLIQLADCLGLSIGPLIPVN